MIILKKDPYFYSFIEPVSKELAGLACELEKSIFISPRTMLTHARTFIESIVIQVIQSENLPEEPQKNLIGYLDILEKNGYLTPDVCDALHYVRQTGNRAAHETRMFRYSEALLSWEAVYKIVKWYIEVYGPVSAKVPPYRDPQLVQKESYDTLEIEHKLKKLEDLLKQSLHQEIQPLNETTVAAEPPSSIEIPGFTTIRTLRYKDQTLNIPYFLRDAFLLPQRFDKSQTFLIRLGAEQQARVISELPNDLEGLHKHVKRYSEKNDETLFEELKLYIEEEKNRRKLMLQRPGELFFFFKTDYVVVTEELSKTPFNKEEFQGVPSLLKQLKKDQIETVGQFPKELVLLAKYENVGIGTVEKLFEQLKEKQKKKAAINKEPVESEPNRIRHYERCSECKNTIIEMFREIYGTVKIEHKMEISSRLKDYEGTSYHPYLKKIHDSLSSYRGYERFIRSSYLQPCDIYVPDPGFLVEMDETQHFSQPRELSLSHYPPQLKVGYSLEKWIDKCNKIKAKDGNPVYRDEQRAWYDTLRDFVPLIKGLQPTIRIAMKDWNWCELDPSKEEDVEKFKSLVSLSSEKGGEREKDQKVVIRNESIGNLKIGTLCLKSNQRYNNKSRNELLTKVIDETPEEVDVLLLPAGFYAIHRAPKKIYKEISDHISSKLKKEKRNLVICLGVDGNNGSDQMGLAISKNGIEAIGRKFYPTKEEKPYLKRASTHLELEDGYSRTFQVKGKKLYIAVCYDSFGAKMEDYSNPGVDIILNLVHQFHPKGQGNSGDVFFARHGLAGASQYWNLPVYGAAVFFHREIPPNWPTGVIWDPKIKHTKEWKYEYNLLGHKKEIVISIPGNRNESAMMKIY